MLKIACHVGLVTDVELPPGLIDAFKNRLPEYFRRASLKKDGDAAIDLHMLEAVDGEARIPEDEDATVVALNEVLSQVTGTPNKLKNGVDRVGLLLAHRCAPPHDDVLGLMFDGALEGSDAASEVQRQGAAIFLGGIHAAVKKRVGSALTTADLVEQAVFVAAHELGHVFNIWHVEKPSFMLSRPSEEPGPFEFVEDHRKFLALAEESEFVQPGGSPWNDRGTLAAPQSDPFFSAKSRTAPFSMTTRVHPRRFWCFEPVLLDIRISTSDATVKTRSLPDELDLGYDSFNVWVTDPNGERRLLRPFAVYVETTKRMRLPARSPFERDMPIGHDRNGPVFRMAGLHLIDVAWRISARNTLRHTSRVEVLVDEGESAEYREARDLLSHPAVLQFLYYREARPSSGAVERVLRHIDRYPRSRLASAARYALGRLHHRSLVKSGTSAAAVREAALAERHLAVAVRSKQTSALRRKRAAKLLRELHSRPRP